MKMAWPFLDRMTKVVLHLTEDVGLLALLERLQVQEDFVEE